MYDNNKLLISLDNKNIILKNIKFKGVKFFFGVVILLIALLIFDFHSILKIINKIDSMVLRLIPIIILVIIFTALINYFLKPQSIMKYFGKNSGKKGVFLALLAGIISHGPMYAWYPMLIDMRKNGLKFSLIAIFLYARAVKIPLLPFMIALFGLPFAIIANIYILIFAIIQGIMIEFLMKNKKGVNK